MNRCVRFVALATFVLLAAQCGWTAEPDVNDLELPRVPPTDPDKALATFRVKKGFHLEQAAAEPLVFSPIAMSFDENGRLFVVEMRDYSERRNETPHLGRVRMLEDLDGDGRFDKSAIYVDNLPWPTGVFCYGGGVFVGTTPDILYCKDTNGDGVADVREVVFTGFAADYAPYQTNRLNVQAMFNSFNWGLDNRIHGATSLSGGKVHLVDSPFTREWIRQRFPDSQSLAPRPAVDLRGRDFSFDPRRLDFRAESGGGQHGLSFNSAGRKFVCSNSSHLQALMYDEEYAARNPYWTMSRALVDIAADGPAAEVFRVSPDEPWRVLRTRWRVAGLAAGPVEGGGRPSGYFTGATGVTIYRGDAFPEEYRENAFVADCGSNLVHRKKLFPDEGGVGLVGRRPADEQKIEFLASTDNWFRPVQMANAPDGCLYIADMYREVIEHPWSLPDSIKKHLDLNSGNDRGRIYRIVPDGFRQPKPPALSNATTEDLVASLASSNGWYRDTAARLLYQRQDKAAVPRLEKMLQESNLPFGRMHALYALDGLGMLRETHLLGATGDPDEVVRGHAVRLIGRHQGDALQTSERAASATLSSKLSSALAPLAGDSSAFVRYQVAFALGGVAVRERIAALVQIIRQDVTERWTREAVLNSLGDGGDSAFSRLISDARFLTQPSGREFVQELAGVVGRKNDPQAVSTVLAGAVKCDDRSVAFGAIAALGRGLQQKGSTLSQALSAEQLKLITTQSQAVAVDRAATSAERTAAIELLALSGGRNSREALLPLLTSDQPEAIQSSVVRALGQDTDADLANELLRRWNSLASRPRGEILPLLLKRTESTKELLAAVERGEMARAEFSVAQLQALRSSSDEVIRQQTIRLFGEPAAATRQETVSAYFPALNSPGDAARGKVIYLERCASCHRLAGQGYALGPDLVTVKTSGKESLLVNILDPNRQVAPSYLNYTIETRDGQTLSGLIATESAASVTLRGPNGIENIVPRSQIGRLQSQGQSVMPEGLETGLKIQDMADLLAWITTAE